MPVWVEKETAMQIEDKNVLNSLTDAVLVATARLKLAPSISFEIKCMNVLENITKTKNVCRHIVLLLLLLLCDFSIFN